MIEIVYSVGSGFELSGTPPELRCVRDRIIAFVSDDVSSVIIPSNPKIDPRPYDRTMNGLVLGKAETLTRVGITTGGWMEAHGTGKCLTKFSSYFDFDDETPAMNHIHFEHFEGNEWIDYSSTPLVIRISRRWSQGLTP